MIDLRDHDLELSYPCTWVYKVIGRSEEAVREAIRDVLQERERKVCVSRKSASGKYCCLNVELTVHDATDRVEIYNALSSHPLTKIVL